MANQDDSLNEERWRTKMLKRLTSQFTEQKREQAEQKQAIEKVQSAISATLSTLLQTEAEAERRQRAEKEERERMEAKMAESELRYAMPGWLGGSRNFECRPKTNNAASMVAGSNAPPQSGNLPSRGSARWIWSKDCKA